MTGYSRRLILGGAGACLALPTWAAAKPRQKGPTVVVIGGGFGGATAAKYLKRADPSLRVVLITGELTHITCPFSNTVIGGFASLAMLERNYDTLKSRWGIIVVTGMATAIDTAKREVKTSGGASFGYDRLIVSPGIDFKWGELEGYDEAAAQRMPHAWKAGPQTTLLRRQLEAMEDGGLVVMSVPGNPFRCPPGPYERASLIAWYLKQAKPRSKLMILDAKDSFSKQALFQEGWGALFGDRVEWVPAGANGRVVRLDAKGGWVETDFDRFFPAVTNIIPPQKAGKIAAAAGLTDSSGFCPVDPATFESRLVPGIHVIGDACIAGEMPKSASSANAQGKITAAVVAAQLQGEAAPEAKVINICYSLLSPDYGISVTGVYGVRGGIRASVAGAGGVSPLGADAHFRKAEADYAFAWYASICSDSWA
ncbi:Sulfide dehydrogenase (flavocytochrome c) flavoprotein chain [Candidatus Terasakiella magnetica]|nr:Sulfide dehydrogenase (flavocytochrome c) flavoprotein chain [Candidatus Terasakiella magnetica]